mmetsp:Transcript_15977/g.23351  ORF Transcript_15977/g.23351 Transcript_15977/m.23351 type:complete len:1212 (+) Transcript_15977:136-3771(+)
MFSLPFLFPNEEATTESNSPRKSATAINNRVTGDIITQQQELDPTNQGVEVLKYYISEDESSSDNSSVMSYENEEGSDESDSRFMSEQGELSFMALHHHQRVRVDSNTGFLSPLKNDEDGYVEPGKITIGGVERRDTGPISPLDLTLQVKTVRSDEASLISSIGPGDFVENGAMSDASASVDLNPYENGVSSPKMSAATRWRRNKNKSDLERRNKRGRPKKDAIASKTSLTRQHMLINNNAAVRSSHIVSRKVDPEAPEKYYSPRLPPPPPPLMTKKYSGSQFQISPEQSKASGKAEPSCRRSKPLVSGSMSATTNIKKAPKLHSAIVNETDEYVSFGNTFGDGLSTALSTETSNANENHPEYKLLLGSESPSRSRSIARTPTLSIGSRHPHEPNPLKQFIPLQTSASRRVATVSLSPGRATHNIASRYRSTSSQVSRSTPRSDVTSFSLINNTRSRENDVEYKDSIPIIKPSPLLTSTNIRRDVAPREEQVSERKDSNTFTCESPTSGSKTRQGKSMFLDRLSELKQSPPSKSAHSNLTAQSIFNTTNEQHCNLQTNTLSPPSILKNPIHRQRKKEWMSQMWCPENEEWDRVDLSLDDVRRQINFSTSRDRLVSIRKSVTKHAVTSMNKTESLTDDDSLDDILNSQGPPISDTTSEVFSPSVIGDDNSSSLGLSTLKMRRSKNSIASEKHESECISGKVGDWNAFGEEEWTFSSSDGYISNAGSISINASFDDEWLHTNSSKAIKTADAKNARRNKKKNSGIENTIPFVRNTRGLKKSKIHSLRKQIPQGQQESKWMVRHSGNDKAAAKIQATFRGRSCRNRLIEKLGVAKRKKWESRGSRSSRVTKIHSKIRRSARNRLRTRHAMNATDMYLASMVVSIRHICAATIQQWWKISKKSLGETRAMGFDSSAFPTAWTENKTSYDMFPDLFSDLISSQKYDRPNSRESTTPTSDTSTSRSENFDVEYYQKPQANFHDDEVDANLDMDDEAFVSQVSLLTKMQNGFVGRVLKIFKRHPIMKKKYGDSDESKPKKKKKKIRLKAFRKDKRKIKDTALEPVMIGDAQANEALPDPNSLYQPLEEDIEEEMAFRRLLSPHRETRKESNDIGNGDVDTLQFSPSGTRMKKSEHGLLTKQEPNINTAVHIVSPGASPTGDESDIVLDDLEVDSNAVISNMMGSVELRNSTWETIGSIEGGNVIKGTRTFESIPFDEI